MINKRSCGIDGIDILTVKNNIDIFLPILHHIFSKSLAQNVFPDTFKIACVIPIFKHGSKTEFSSYRPISLINTVAKIFETLIKNQLLDYLVSRSIFSPYQFGFLPNKGTDLAIQNHIQCIAESVDRNKFTAAVYLDFQKAFDLVEIDILMKRFETYGIAGNALAWLNSFCRKRKQLVKVNKYVSNTLELRHGVAQGGVLGPMMFNIFINELLKIKLNSKIFAYADDTAVVCSAYNKSRLRHLISSDLEKLSQWLSNNKLLINVSKSKCILFFDRNISCESLQKENKFYCHKHQCIYGCNCDVIEIVDNVKYLGLTIDRDLKWNVFINTLSTKLRKINYAIYHMRGFLKPNLLRQLYTSWFEGTLQYGIIHYGGTYESILIPIKNSQRFAVRNIYNLKKYDRISHLFKEDNILTFNQLYVYHCLNYIYKFLDSFDIKKM
ncbi:hypothetical protein J6590_108172 [Homalodisca vitripennis]|nr:hypothetical protein J6590_108172 [Homalodisca vitripennis]